MAVGVGLRSGGGSSEREAPARATVRRWFGRRVGWLVLCAIAVAASVSLTYGVSQQSGPLNLHNSFQARVLQVAAGESSVCVQPLGSQRVICDTPAAETGTLRSGEIVTAAILVVTPPGTDHSYDDLVLVQSPAG